MKKKFTDILNMLPNRREYTLTRSERERMTHVMREYMAHKPLRSESYSVSITYRWFSFSHRPMIAALALVLIFGGGISYAAEGALPGDALYAIKTYINEPARVALATNPEAKAQVQIALAERRIDEAATLAAEGRLDSSVQASLATAFEAHASAVSKNIEETDLDDSPAAAELASRFETRLAAHDEILSEIEIDPKDAKLADAIHGAGRNVAELRARVEEKASVSAPLTLAEDTATFAVAMAKTASTEVATVSASGTAEANADTSRTAERMRLAAKAQLGAVQRLVGKRARIDSNIEDQLTQAKEYIDAGEKQRDDNEYALAFHSYQDSLVITEKLDVLLKAAPTLAKMQSRRNATRTEIRNDTRAASSKKKDVLPARAASAPAPAAATLSIEAASGTASTSEASDEHDVKTETVIPPSVKIFPSNNEEEDEDSEDLKIDVSI